MLNKKQVEVVTAVFNGMSQNKAAQEFGMSQTAVNVLMHTEDAEDLQLELTDRLLRNSAYAKAVNVIVEALNSNNENIRLKAAKDIIELRGKQMEAADRSVMVVFEGMPSPDPALTEIAVDGDVE